MGSHPIGLEAAANSHPPASLSTQTVTVYTRHQESCRKNGEPYWKQCHCMKYLYVYRENTSRQVSAKTRSWERAEERAQEIRDSWSPVKALQPELEAKVRRSEAREVLISDAVARFMKEVERLNREEATRAKYRLTLEDRLLNWCAQQKPPVARLSELDVETMRPWIHSWPGAPTTRHNQHQRVITFFFFCVEQGWMKENPARKIKKVAPEQDDTQPFTHEQYDALIQATWIYDSRDGKKSGDTAQSPQNHRPRGLLPPLASLITLQWMSHVLRAQLRSQLFLSDKGRRQELYREFVDEASRSYIDSLTSNTPDLTRLVALYALISRMRSLSSPKVIEEAEKVGQLIVRSYPEPNKTFADLRSMINEKAFDPLRSFSESCRAEVERLK